MTNENAQCSREKCGYKFFSRIVDSTGKAPKQCPVCKRYNSVKIKK
jgi:predicted Zn-ribbon and HTH transcriptional regulator